MQAEFKKDIKYFVVNEESMMEWLGDYDDSLEFFKGRVGQEVIFHIGHKKGFCSCRQELNGLAQSFTTQLYPCIYPTGTIESVQEVEYIESHENSIDFTIGMQNKSFRDYKSFMVGVSGFDDLGERLESASENLMIRYQKPEVEDMNKIFAACNPLFARDYLFGLPSPTAHSHGISIRKMGTRFNSGEQPRLLNEEKGSRFLDYSIDNNYKYHILLCD